MRNFFPLFILAMLILSSCGARRSVLQSPSGQGKHKNHKGTTVGSRPAGTSATAQAYIQQYYPIAVQEMNTYGIPASIKLAQALLESGNGTSYLATQANNHFGIKCGGVWKGPSVTRPDDHINDCFRVYKQVEESFKDHSHFLLRKRYAKLFSLDKDDYKGWAKGLKEAGYATNPRYAALLIDLIERHELYRFDRQEQSAVAREQREQQVDQLIVAQTIPEQSLPAEQIKKTVAMTIHEVKAQDTLYSLSKRYQVSVAQIQQLNNLLSDQLSIGQLLIISK